MERNKRATVVMFPGVDALEDPKYREAVWQVQGIRDRILWTQRLIEATGEESFDLAAFMRGEEMEEYYFIGNLILCGFATQVAIFEAYERQGLPCDYLMGVSLGDVARNVCAKVGTFEVAVVALVKFVGLVRQSHQDPERMGSTHFLKIPQPYDELKEDLQFDAFGLTISVLQNNRFFLLAGRNQDFEKWNNAIGQKMGLNLRFMYPFALHSDMMKGVARELKPYLDQIIHFDRMKYDLFSTITQDVITREDELKEEINLNIVKTVKFMDTVKTIFERFEEVQFVNIGPAPTLITFIKLLELETEHFSLDNYFTTWLDQQVQPALGIRI